jgi:DivIVA domain-containing protein
MTSNPLTTRERPAEHNPEETDVSITPADIEAQKFPIVLRGYKVEAVDAFLDRLQTDLAERLAAPAGERVMTASDAAAVDEEPKAGAAVSTTLDADRLPGAEHGHAARALRTLARAEEMADQMMADAASEADEIRGRAHMEAEDIIAAAKGESDRVETELQMRRQLELGALAMQAHELRAEIDRLSRLERQYHDVMQAFLSEQERLLERRIPVPPAETAPEPPSAEDADRAAA